MRFTGVASSTGRQAPATCEEPLSAPRGPVSLGPQPLVAITQRRGPDLSFSRARPQLRSAPGSLDFSTTKSRSQNRRENGVIQDQVGSKHSREVRTSTATSPAPSTSGDPEFTRNKSVPIHPGIPTSSGASPPRSLLGGRVHQDQVGRRRSTPTGSDWPDGLATKGHRPGRGGGAGTVSPDR